MVIDEYRAEIVGQFPVSLTYPAGEVTKVTSEFIRCYALKENLNRGFNQRKEAF